ncbi:hypothetical protein NEAUS03_0880, partial [Nematocida ausubeli]
GKADILSQIIITYTFDKEYNGISLGISQGHATLSLFSSLPGSSENIKEKYEEVKNTYSEVECYVGYIADHYVSTELDTLFFNKADFSKKLKKILVPVIQEGSEGIYKIFLLEKLVSNEIKGLIINSFIDSTIDKEVGPANTLTRFTANILGSVPLNDPNTRYTMLKHFPLHSSWQEFYPKLGFKPSENIPKEDAIWVNIAKVYTYTALANLPAPAALKALCNYLRATANNTRMEYSGVYCITRTHLFEHIVSKERVDRLVEIQSILKESTKGYNLNYVYLLWFIHVSSGVGGFSLESIKIVYDFILFDNYPKPLVFEEGISGPAEYFKKSLSVLKENKTLFCSKDDRKSIKKYNGLVSYLRKFIKTKNKGCFYLF